MVRQSRRKLDEKSYVSRYKDLSISFPMDNDRTGTVRFVNGELSTVFADAQEHIEGMDQFQTGIIAIKPSPKQAAVAKAQALRAIAVKAHAEAKAAEAIAAGFDSKQ